MENKEKIELREHLLNIRDKYSHTLGIYDFAFYQGHFKSLIDAFTIKTLEDDFGVLLTIKDGNDLTTYTRYISARNIIDITNDVKVINKILGDAVIAYNIISCKYEPDLMVAPDNEQYDVDSANKENNSNTEEIKKAWHEDYKNWIFVGNRQPKDTFICIVKMFNEFSETWTTGTGIFDNGEWEATDSSGESLPVRYWRRCPDFEVEGHYVGLKEDIAKIYVKNKDLNKTLKIDNLKKIEQGNEECEDSITRALDFNLGDLVVLKSDATKVMTVSDVNSSYAVVCMFWSNDQLVQMEFPIYTIQKI